MNITKGTVAVAGLPVLGAGAIANAGSSQAISKVGTATAVARTWASGTRGFCSPDAQTYNEEALAITKPRTLLECVKLANGC